MRLEQLYTIKKAKRQRVKAFMRELEDRHYSNMGGR